MVSLCCTPTTAHRGLTLHQRCSLTGFHASQGSDSNKGCFIQTIQWCAIKAMLSLFGFWSEIFVAGDVESDGILVGWHTELMSLFLPHLGEMAHRSIHTQNPDKPLTSRS